MLTHDEYECWPMVDIDWLLGTISTRRFLGHYFEKDIFYNRGKDTDRFSFLFDLKNLDQALKQHGPEVRRRALFYKSGVKIDPGSQIDGDDFRRWVQQHFRGKGSVVINEMEKFCQPLERIHRDLENSLHCRVQTNLYITPGGAYGFRPHYDTHDVFIIQIQGKKTWKFYASDLKLPLMNQGRYVDPDRLGNTARTIDLSQGDVLYVPRGFIHQATSGGSTSMHLTAGIYPFNLIDLVVEILWEAAANDSRWRQGILGRDVQDTTRAIVELVSETADHVHTSNACEKALRCIAQKFAGTRTLPAANYMEHRSGEIQPDDVVEKAEGLLCCLAKSDDGQVELTFSGRPLAITSPPFMMGALKFIVASDQPFEVSTIPGSFPDHLKRALVKNLINHGFLRRCDGTCSC